MRYGPRTAAQIGIDSVPGYKYRYTHETMVGDMIVDVALDVELYLFQGDGIRWA